MEMLKGFITRDGVIHWGERPKPRIDIALIPPPNSFINEMFDCVRKFVDESFGKDTIVTECRSFPDRQFTLAIVFCNDVNGKYTPPDNFKNIGIHSYIGKDKSCLIICGTTFWWKGAGDPERLQLHLRMAYAECLTYFQGSSMEFRM